jgi:iron-sulfur cluster assembly accessory protein
MGMYGFSSIKYINNARRICGGLWTTIGNTYSSRIDNHKLESVNILTSVHKFSSKSTENAKKTPLNPIITLTENAIKKLKSMKSEQDPNAITLRVTVKTKGCSGHSYALEWVTEKKKFDEEIVQNGVRIFVDSKALMSIIGARMDYVEEPLKSEFVFDNPNIKGKCGCGQSFYI